MDAVKLKQLLFANNTRLYAILDGVMVAGLPDRLYRSGLTYECLVSGDLTPAMTLPGHNPAATRQNTPTRNLTIRLASNVSDFCDSERLTTGPSRLFRGNLLGQLDINRNGIVIGKRHPVLID